jgi:enamine deaminase RidA (YjgF/YER057c/UK114 family)
MPEIKRMNTARRMSQAVVHNGTVYLAGQVGTPGASVEQQTRDILAKIEQLLDAAGTDKRHILQAVIWLKSMDDFAEMNAVWDAWVPEGHAPARACGSADLATPEYTVEITVIAAQP